jgi:hypothetical protein
MKLGEIAALILVVCSIGIILLMELSSGTTFYILYIIDFAVAVVLFCDYLLELKRAEWVTLS